MKAPEKIQFTDSGFHYNNSGSQGCFFTITGGADCGYRAEHIYGCRDSLAVVIRKDYQGGFQKNHLLGMSWSLEKKRDEKVEEFFTKIEDQLGLDERTVIVDCERTTEVLLFLAPFWVGNQVKKSIFTLLFRCAMIYYEGDMDKAFDSYGLLASIKPVIKRFLAGYTKTSFCLDVGGGEGIVRKTYHWSEKDIEERFVKP